MVRLDEVQQLREILAETAPAVEEAAIPALDAICEVLRRYASDAAEELDAGFIIYEADYANEIVALLAASPAPHGDDTGAVAENARLRSQLAELGEVAEQRGHDLHDARSRLARLERASITIREGYFKDQIKDLRSRLAGLETPDVEAVASKVHEAWMNTKREQGVVSRPSEWGEEQMVPYAELSERAKDLDRGTVIAVFAAIKAARAALTPEES